MTDHITSINLDAETVEISATMRKVGMNRSAFVRECLRRWNSKNNGAHIAPNSSPKCFPFSRSGLCEQCWPVGPPLLEHWQYYKEASGTHPRVFTESSTRWIEEKAAELALTRPPRFSIEGIEASKNQVDEATTPPWWQRLLSGFRKKSSK